MPTEYVLEKITKEYCLTSGKYIEILRLSIGHSELNPIELIWAQVKNEVARNNVDFNMATVKELTLKAIANVTPENWKAVVAHTITVEDAFRRKDFGDERNAPAPIDKFVIHVNFDSDSDSESGDEI